LLSELDPPPFRTKEGAPHSPYLLLADHAGRALPKSLGNLGLGPAELEAHIAWDIGIAGVSERLAEALSAFLILQTYSRLVIDCNRPLESETSIATISENTEIPGNFGLSEEARAARVEAIFRPYHERIVAELERRAKARQPTILLAMHSFTPRFKGVDRKWHCGVLYQRDPRLAKSLLPLLEREGLVVGDNEPYSVSDRTDYAIPRYGEARGLLHVEIEIRQDLIAHEAGQAEWAERLSRLVPEAVARL
jgi:predicted N-formylglutamate amidohydrolase